MHVPFDLCCTVKLATVATITTAGGRSAWAGKCTLNPLGVGQVGIKGGEEVFLSVRMALATSL